MSKLIIRYVRNDRHTRDTKMGKQGDVRRTVITEIKILSMQFYALNLNHRVNDVNRLWIMVRVWKRKFHFDGGKDEASVEAGRRERVKGVRNYGRI